MGYSIGCFRELVADCHGDRQIRVDEEQAEALAQFLKRTVFADYRDHAVHEREAYEMLHAGERLRRALAAAGFAPR